MRVEKAARVGGRADRETGRQGDRETGRQGDKETRRQGDRETGRQGGGMSQKIVSHRDLDVYKRGFDAAMQVFEVSRRFPKEEVYALTDQIRRSSRSVCSNLAEAWRKRRYEAAFISKLSDAEAEAAETQVWLEFAVRCEYVTRDEARILFKEYEEIIRLLVAMITHPENWILTR
jgi:four helix bundle protein